MLEIKNVTKVYKTKGGVDTKALDNVSISFGETGLVFLLGKSGSGKSTLLNVCGGLDEPTSGEVIVKGKSSKDFSGSDFDSYRNTFVGFIFQEYNVLDEFNVEDNIALALELQGKPKDKQKIHELLREVELENFAKRKPNTLSGGQKQRIAIARALIKEPQIIMADEPTGALDSATGKQVFDTLKSLSKTRLVIVVSHDREFAEIYGDRIVELKDGKIISDVTKSAVPPRALDENVTVIGENTLSIKSGKKLTQSNIRAIQDFVLDCDGDVIITKGEKQVSAFKKVNRLTESGATETFNPTKEDDLVLKSYSAEDGKFIRSRLPAGKAIKIGASGLKLKPVRLIFTILLSVIAFIMFGLFSTLMVYDGDSVAASSFASSDYDFLSLKKYYITRVTDSDDDFTWTNTTGIKFTQAELDEFSNEYGDSTFGYYSYRYGSMNVENVNVKAGRHNYYLARTDKFAYVSQSNSMRTKLTGTYPAAADEICISKYLAEVMSKDNSEVYKIRDDGGKVTVSDESVVINSPNDVIGKQIIYEFGNKAAVFKITGYFEDGAIPSKYDKLKESNDQRLQYEFNEYLSEGLNCVVLVSQNFYETYESTGIFDENSYSGYVNYFENCGNNLGYKTSGYFNGSEWQEGEPQNNYLGNSVKAFGTGDKYLNTVFLGGQSRTSLADNEVVLPVNELRNAAMKQVVEYFAPKAEAEQKELNELVNEFNEVLNTYADGYVMVEIEEDGYSYYEPVEATPAQRLEALEKIKEVVNAIQPFELQLIIDDIRTVKVNVVGFHEMDISGKDNDSRNGVYLSQNFIDENLTIYQSGNSQKYETNYVPEEGTVYSGIFVQNPKQEALLGELLSKLGEKNVRSNDVFYQMDNSLYASLEMVNSMAETLSTVFLWVGVVFAVFAALLMFNFISVSIANKRKEIGILRAVGARGVDVFKIFFAESGIIIGICTVLALIGTFLGCNLINGILKAEAGLEVTLFVFGIASVGMMVGIAVLVAFISTFLPVYFASRKKPVDSIRAL